MMTTAQLSSLAKRVARKHASDETIDRAVIIRSVVRTKKLNLQDSIILADCIVRGFYQAGKAIRGRA